MLNSNLLSRIICSRRLFPHLISLTGKNSNNQILKFSSQDDYEKTDIIGLATHGQITASAQQLPQVRSDKPVFLERLPRKERGGINPKDTTVFLFPGQGSQFVGMGSAIFDVPNVEKMFTTAKAILGYDLFKLCINGPEETLNRTEFCQPAIFVTSLAGVEYMRSVNSEQVEACVAAAGFSIGEITALVFAGSISFEDGLRLVKLRGEAMQYASEQVPSAMATAFLYADAKLKLACQAAREWCKRLEVPEEYAVCTVANYLFPHCKVLAGHEEAIKFLELNGRDFGIKKMKRLKVSGAFHTSLMSPASKVLEEALKQIHIDTPLIPVYSNVDGRIFLNDNDVRRKLTQQVCQPVKWEQIMHDIYDRDEDSFYPRTYECGPGSALLSILTMVNRQARIHSKHVKV